MIRYKGDKSLNEQLYGTVGNEWVTRPQPLDTHNAEQQHVQVLFSQAQEDRKAKESASNWILTI